MGEKRKNEREGEKKGKSKFLKFPSIIYTFLKNIGREGAKNVWGQNKIYC